MGDLLWKLPLFDDLYFSMQGQNVMMVDVYLRDLEASLREEYYALDRTPLQSAMFLSALSQMWIFAAYELLRTWKQWVRDIKREAGLARAPQPTKPAADSDGPPDLAEMMRQGYVEKARTDAAFVEALNTATARVEPIFRRIEALRMNLAKHEVKGKSQLAMAPGYSRIDEGTGSLMWFVDLGNNNVDRASRQELGDELREAVIGHLLPEDDAYLEDDEADEEES